MTVVNNEKSDTIQLHNLDVYRFNSMMLYVHEFLEV